MISRPRPPRAASPWLLAGALLLAEPALAQTYAAWQPDTYYTAGTVVTFNGRLYRATVNQTDYASTGWNPTNASLWTDLGPVSGTAPTPSPSPSPTPSPTPSPSPSPTPHYHTSLQLNPVP